MVLIFCNASELIEETENWFPFKFHEISENRTISSSRYHINISFMDSKSCRVHSKSTWCLSWVLKFSRGSVHQQINRQCKNTSLAKHAEASNTKSEATSPNDEEKLIWLKIESDNISVFITVLQEGELLWCNCNHLWYTKLSWEVMRDQTAIS